MAQLKPVDQPEPDRFALAVAAAEQLRREFEPGDKRQYEWPRFGEPALPADDHPADATEDDDLATVVAAAQQSVHERVYADSFLILAGHNGLESSAAQYAVEQALLAADIAAAGYVPFGLEPAGLPAEPADEYVEPGVGE